MYQKKIKTELRCPLEAGVSYFCGKWKVRLLFLFSHGDNLRYGEIKQKLVDVTDAALSTALKELLSDGLLTRTAYEQVPPRVEYSLTEMGRDAIPLLRSLCDWAEKYRPSDVPACREDCGARL